MEIRGLEDALNLLGEASVDARTREAAHHYLTQIRLEDEVPQLVDALRSDNFKVRWEAAKRLREIGRPALRGMLTALVDPHKVGDTRLRNGVYRVLRHHPDPYVSEVTANLLQDLSGSAADLKTLHEAHHVLMHLSGGE